MLRNKTEPLTIRKRIRTAHYAPFYIHFEWEFGGELICPHCGAEISDNEEYTFFCECCGSSINVEPPFVRHKRYTKMRNYRDIPKPHIPHKMPVVTFTSDNYTHKWCPACESTFYQDFLGNFCLNCGQELKG